MKKGQSLFKVLSDADKVEEIKKEQQQMETEREKSAWIDPETRYRTRVTYGAIVYPRWIIHIVV